jgi:hypothetical protein
MVIAIQGLGRKGGSSAVGSVRFIFRRYVGVLEFLGLFQSHTSVIRHWTKERNSGKQWKILLGLGWLLLRKREVGKGRGRRG